MHEREDHFQNEFTDNEGATPRAREEASHDLHLEGEQIDSQADDDAMRENRFHENEGQSSSS